MKQNKYEESILPKGILIKRICGHGYIKNKAFHTLTDILECV